MCDNSQSRTKRADHYMQEDPNSVRKRKMDSSSLHEAKNEDGKVIQPKEYQETEEKTEDEIVKTDEKTEEIGDKTEQQIETITKMGYELYWAAARGDPMLKSKDHLQSLLTPNKNTILHIYITSRTAEDLEPTKFVKEILAMCPELLMQPNTKKETPLHIAARYGHASIVELLIQHAKALHPQNPESGVEAARQMMRMPNQNQDTAFHEAVRFRHLSVVMKILIEEDCDFVYLANEDGETPLYMAAERGYSDIVFEILDKCKSPATGGPLGRNVLHVATIREDEEMIKIIVEKMEALMLAADEKGRTPLHYAANMGYLSAVKLFIESPTGREAAYMKDTEGNTAFHLAAASNHEETTSEIIEWCPECCELVNNEGWNILHAAVQSKDIAKRAMDAILKKNAFSNLLNEKDAKGNTPLHHTSILTHGYPFRLIDHPRVDKMAFNKQNKTALDLASSSKNTLFSKNLFVPDLKEKGLKLGIRMHTPLKYDVEENGDKDESNLSEPEKDLDKAKEANLIVAALIATVTFTAGFTVPGGFVSEKGPLQGTPILGKTSAFKTFIIMDTIAMALSSSAVFVHLFFRSGDVWLFSYYFSFALILTVLAMAAMVVAFVTGTYAMLGYSTALSVVTCVTGLSFFFSFYKVFKPHLKKYCIQS